LVDAVTPKQRKFSKKDWDTAAQFVKDEFERRKNAKKRRDAEKAWKEVDRQVAMIPRPREIESGTAEDWMPDIELPLQASALEVIAADARRLKFPLTTDWFFPHSDLSDSFLQKAQISQDKFPIIGDTPTGMQLDQEGVDAFVKAVIDHYHKLYAFRSQIELMDLEAIKYGTYSARVVQALVPKFSNDFRGIRKERTLGPAVVPVSIKNLYLDDSPQALLQEGLSVAPATIRNYYQKQDDILKAANTGGVNKGWIPANVKKLEPLGDGDEKRGHIEILEYEGDLIIPRSQGRIFLPNIILTVAVGASGPTVIRFRDHKFPFRSYVTGTYQREDLDSPYGVSPLMKGAPIQEAATEAVNNLIAASALSAQPPVAWDSSDTRLSASGGPLIAPRALWETDDPNSIKVQDIGDINDILQAYLSLLQQYADLTGVTATRRGQQARSHTTATAADIESDKGLARTVDFVVSQEQGPMTSILYMEYEIIRQSLTKPQSVYIGGTAGLDGFVNINKDLLPESVMFDVQGSAGPLTKREQNALETQAIQAAAQLSQLSASMGGPVLNFDEAFRELFANANVSNPDRFITSPQGIPNAASGVGGVPGTDGMVQEEPTTP
jgi:hypothetical protein